LEEFWLSLVISWEGVSIDHFFISKTVSKSLVESDGAGGGDEGSNDERGGSHLI
jgi:hypothetical protein